MGFEEINPRENNYTKLYVRILFFYRESWCMQICFFRPFADVILLLVTKCGLVIQAFDK